MADWRIVTPTRAPKDDELGPLEGVSGASSTRAIVFAARVFKSANYSISYISVESTLSVTISGEKLYYNLDNGVWSLSRGGEGVNIADYDMTIPENEVNSAEKYPYFDLIAYENGTTACKLAVTNEAKTLIRNALINKGVDVPDTTPFRQYAGKVGEIQSGVSLNGRILKAYSYSAAGSGTVQLEEGKKYVIFLNMVDSRNYARFAVRVYTILEPGTLSLQNEYKNSSFAGQFVFTLDGNNLNYSHYTDYYIFDFVVIEQ